MIPEAVREFFLLGAAERRATAVGPERRAIVARYLEAASNRLWLVPGPSDRRTSIASATHLREAIGLLVRAFAASESADLDERRTRELDPGEELRRIFDHSPSAPPGWQQVAAFFATDDCLFVDGLDDEELRSLARALESTASWLRERTDARSPAYLRGARWGRVGALGLVATYVVGATLVGIVRPNLALHKTVTQSSVWPGSAPGSALVDGDASGDSGPGQEHCNLVHTGSEDSPWMMIDLGSVHALHEVRVHNRNDHDFDHGLPMTLELSTDGKTFAKVAERTTHFGTTPFDPPWTADVRGRDARFVRVRGHALLVLSEVEVH